MNDQKPTTDNRQSSPGMIAVLNGFLEHYEPADTFDPDDCILMRTYAIIFELQYMYDFSANELADHLATLGYRYHVTGQYDIAGWILRRRNPDSKTNA